MARKKKVVPTVVQPVEPYLEGVAKSLVDRIYGAGDVQFAKRAEAARKIVALNQAVIAKLKTAVLSKDADFAFRAKDCVKNIYRSHHLRAVSQCTAAFLGEQT